MEKCNFLFIVISFVRNISLLTYFSVNVFMSTCFVLTLACLRAGLCGGWVSDMLWWGVGRSTCWEGNFYRICRLLICNFTEHVSFLQVFFVHFAEADYLLGFCVDWCLGRKGLIVTWRQILNCDMTRESMHMGERGRAYTYVCAYMCARGHACLFACGCSYVHLRACVKTIFNCILTIACTCA